MATPRLRLGQLLVDAKLITNDDLEAVLALQKTDGRRLGTLLVERGLVNETQLTQILSHQLSVPWVSLLHIEFSRQLLNLVPQRVAERFCLVPIFVRHVRNQGETLYVAMDDPSNEEALRACTEHSGLPARSMIAPPQDILNAIRVYYGVVPKAPSQPAPAIEAERAAPPPAPPPPTPEPEPRPVVPPQVALEIVPPAPEPRAEPAKPEEPTAEAAPPSAASTETPDIETVEIQLRQRRPLSEPSPASERPVTTIPKPKGRTPRMIALTLLDGTTISLPAKPGSARHEPEPEASPAPLPSPDGDDAEGLTARDLVAALRAVSHGADATEILGGDYSWEAMFAALLSLLLKKHLIADWEYVDELKKKI